MKNKILIVEDNHELRENIAEILQLSGYETIEAENGKVGVQKALEQLPDLILCDIMMPELDGFGVLKILNKNTATNTIPFIFLTAKGEKSDWRKGMGLGADDYITKPFDDTDLLTVIEMRLAKSQRLQARFKEFSGVHSLMESESDIMAIEKLVDVDQKEFRAKETIYAEGNRVHWLYQLKKGRIKITRENEFGKQLITQLISVGEYFGYDALFKENVYSETAIALETCVVQLIPKNLFHDLLNSRRDLAMHFIKLISNRQKQCEENLLDMAYSTVRKKVANALLHFAKADQPTIEVNREDLAAIAGTAKESLIRTLSSFKKEGLIETSGNKIELKDKKALILMRQ